MLLLIGILAVLAIPSFFNQAEKAYDADAKAGARQGVAAMAEYAAERNGYAGATVEELRDLEPGLREVPLTVVGTTQDTYEIAVSSEETGNVYRLARDSEGSVRRTCAASGVGGCHDDGGW